MYINVAPLLLHLFDCFTTLIVDEAVDYGPVKYPIALMRPRHEAYPKTACNITATESATLSFWQGQKGVRICKKVLENYNIKGTRCVGVMSIFPREGYGETHMYWYLNYYWSRSESQTYLLNKKYPADSTSSIAQFFPTEIKLQVLLPEAGSRAIVTSYKEIKYEWIPYARLPILTISVSQTKIELAEFTATVSLVFFNRSPTKLKAMEFNSHKGINSSLIRQRVELALKYAYKVHLVLEASLLKFEALRFKNIPWEWRTDYPPLYTFISNVFNRTKVEWRRFLKDKGPGSLWTIATYERTSMELSIDTDTEFLIGEDDKVLLLTCAGLVPGASWGHLADAYDQISWGGLLLVMLGMCGVFWIFSHHRRIGDNPLEAVISILLEQSYSFKTRPRPPLAFLMLIFLLMGIILSNGYKGVVTTSVVKPFDRKGVTSLQAALDHHYKSLVHNFNINGLLKNCCRKEGLKTKYETKKIVKAGGLPKGIPEIMDCGDILALGPRFEMLRHIRNNTIRNALKFWLLRRGNLSDWKGSRDETSEDKLVVSLVKYSKPTDCAYPSESAELKACNNTFYLLSSRNIERDPPYRQVFNTSRKYGDPIYFIKKSNNAFLPEFNAFIVWPLSVARGLLRQLIRAFDESGIKENAATLRQFQRHLKITRDMKRVHGKLDHLDSGPVAMGLSSNVYYSFLLYLYCVGGALALFILETVRTYIQFLHKLYILMKHIFPKPKLKIRINFPKLK